MDQEKETDLFVQFVTGHGQMALMFLGELENPHTGEPNVPEPRAARVFIEQLEMLEIKTRGNLTPEEARVLKETLAVTREALAEVEARPSTSKSTSRSTDSASPEDEPGT